ncbi:MAG: holo-ACP synthase [Candidatus Nitronauta litoralis]|uniref:Holo-[acyl-carrier-protein] synthase n=1 Tax=Candidatus Nitronauta litoralis TaxID=2705533 RepID=A0A7T0G0P3_9BACT|nr:MAG: holo-ACP synthase [Candidatus Nitronauta litoralis]
MIFGTGLDIIEIKRIKSSIGRFSGKFEERIFTADEIAYCRARSNPFPHFAGRFAAKEAVMKSLGTGMAEGIRWKDMEVLSLESGKPELKLTGKSKDLADSKNIKHIHISISHDRIYAVAHAIAES